MIFNIYQYCVFNQIVTKQKGISWKKGEFFVYCKILGAGHVPTVPLVPTSLNIYKNWPQWKPIDSYYQETLESSNLCWSFLIWFFIFPLYTIVHISNSNYGLNLFELLKTYAKLSKSQEHVQKKHFLKFWKHIHCNVFRGGFRLVLKGLEPCPNL